MRRRTLLGSAGAALVVGSCGAGGCWPFAPAVDATTLHHKLLFGYQGWYGAPGDGSLANQWVHWNEPWSEPPGPDDVAIDNWPDMTEFDDDELFPTDLRYPDGSVAKVYSAYREKTVRRHFDWMRDYGIDGVLVQRFLESPWNPANRDFRDRVALSAKAAANASGRVFAVEYDISPPRRGALLDDLRSDWIHLVDDLQLTSSGRYLRHNGRPVLGIWGLGFAHVPEDRGQVKDLIHWFRNEAPEEYRVTLIGGVPADWRGPNGPAANDPAWPETLLGLDVLSPWYVGAVGPTDANVEEFTQNVVGPDITFCRENGRELMPVVFPGFSWHNLWARRQDPTRPFNSTPRRGGAFWWKQLYEYIDAGAIVVKGAMFDENDEGTAMYKLAPTRDKTPVKPFFVTLDADGISLPSDWYLRIAGEGSRMLRSDVALTPTIPIEP